MGINMQQNHKPHYRPQGVFGTIHRPMKIKEVIQENHNTKTFIFHDSLPEAKPGQFVMAWLPRVKEAPFCIANAGPFMLTVCDIGPFSHAINQLKSGDRLWIRGPYGTCFTHEKGCNNPLLVGGGYGSAPLAFLAEQQIKNGQKPVAIIGARGKGALIGLKCFKEVMAVTEDGSYGEKGMVTLPVERLLKEKKGDCIYGVGPNPMLAALQELGERYHVPTQLSWEEHMSCAIGLCGSCEKFGKLLCVEGPVLHYS